MRLDQVYHKVDAIRRRLGHGRRDVDREALQKYAEIGELPRDPVTLAFARLSEAAGRAMDASVSADDAERDRAQREYDQCLRRWQEVTQ